MEEEEEEEEEEEYFVPLQDQRVFGAGIKRKRVNFIPAEAPSSTPKPQISSNAAPGDRYLSIVLRDQKPLNIHERGVKDTAKSSPSMAPTEIPPLCLCEICSLPIESSDNAVTSNPPHEASLAHRVCLSHSNPPSHLDRTRQGLKYLSSYGWDPDSRLGLGATGAGIRAPIKGKEKNNTVGLGCRLPTNGANSSLALEKEIEKLDARQTRVWEEAGKRKRERLQEIFYRNDDVQRYLGGG
ncbi:hypothetical protein MMC06_003735 [Schaereria dolodes]|nr:hypothetical protein [Schaereria dolodes]